MKKKNVTDTLKISRIALDVNLTQTHLSVTGHVLGQTEVNFLRQKAGKAASN